MVAKGWHVRLPGGACMVAGRRAWLPGVASMAAGGGMCGWQGGVCGCGGCVWLLGGA